MFKKINYLKKVYWTRAWKLGVCGHWWSAWRGGASNRRWQNSTTPTQSESPWSDQQFPAKGRGIWLVPVECRTPFYNVSIIRELRMSIPTATSLSDLNHNIYRNWYNNMYIFTEVCKVLNYILCLAIHTWTITYYIFFRC